LKPAIEDLLQVFDVIGCRDCEATTSGVCPQHQAPTVFKFSPTFTFTPEPMEVQLLREILEELRAIRGLVDRRL
jgi:hypothetical protein